MMLDDADNGAPDAGPLVDAWVRYVGERRDEDFWAWERVISIVSWDGDAERARDLMAALVEHAPEELLGDVGAGPLENLIVHRGAELVEWIEHQAWSEPRFFRALGYVWLEKGALPADVEARIVRASGGAIEPVVIEADRHLPGLP